MIGQSIGHYQVTARIGAGGMGEVYRARDTRLERDVALKVLPDAFSGDAERLVRFEREARLLASLKHANIATIHGVEVDGERRVLVMELVEGEDLSQRLARGPVPPDEALALARQIADALEAAHEQGVIHRDLKPANVVVTPDGDAKVLDFGLAKAAETDASTSALSHSPTLLGSSPTAAGVILGTAAYMSPEQARGKRVDRRADIFAFGCVLFEMLSGRQTFSGETVSDTLAAILRAEPEWSALPPHTPRAVRRLLERCLEKDPRQRLRDIGEARILLDLVTRGEAKEEPAAAIAPETGRTRLTWILAGLLAVCASGWLFSLNGKKGADAALVTAAVNLPPESPMSLYGAHPGPPVVSPDGRMVAFALISASGIRLAVRDLARDEVRTFSGTDDAGYPFWSPDSRQIGFFSEGKLKRVDVTGGVPVTVCDAEVGKGGTWREDGTILFAPSYTTAIHRVSATGGPSVAVTRLDSTQNESSHRFPRFLPDGEHFLYVVRHFSADDRGGHTLRVASLDGSVSRDLFATESDAMFANGYLFFIREGALIAQPFDVKGLAVGGNPVKLAEGLGVMTGAAHGIFDVSPSGVMVYGQGANASERHLLMLDADGHSQGELGQGNYDEPIHLSPDGRTLLAGIHDAIGGTSDLWLIDLARGAKTRLTFDPGHDNNALWSPDGTRVIFTAQRGSTFGPYLKPVDGGVTETRLFDNDKDLFNAGWSPDGRYLLCHELGAASNQGRLRAIALADGVSGDPLENHQMPPSLGGGLGLYRITFSPDSRWMAYESTEGERENVYAIPFGRPGQRWQITLAGGSNPRWAGKHLYFVRERRLWKIAVESRANTLVVGDETQVFNDRWVDDFDVAGDESRIIILTDDSLSGGSSLTLVLNWRDLLLAQR